MQMATSTEPQEATATRGKVRMPPARYSRSVPADRHRECLGSREVDHVKRHLPKTKDCKRK